MSVPYYYGMPSYSATSKGWDVDASIEDKSIDHQDYVDGKIMAASDKVRGCRGHKAKSGAITLIANVIDSGVQQMAKVVVDTNKSTIRSFTCDCYDYQDTKRMCCHSVAVAYTWLSHEYPTLFGHYINRPSYIQWCKKLPTQPGAFGAHPTEAEIAHLTEDNTPRTSWSITNLINTFAADALKEQQSIFADLEQEMAPVTKPAEITCVLRYLDSRSSGNTIEDIWSLGFKITLNSKAFVVKSLSGFLGAWRAGTTLVYGKNTEFNHAPANFSDHANDLIRLVSDIVSTQEHVQRYQQGTSSRSYGYYMPSVNDKTVPLSSEQLFGLLKLESGRQVRLEGGLTAANNRLIPYSRSVTVVSENPIVRIELERADAYGFSIAITSDNLNTIMAPNHLAIEMKGRLYLCEDAYAREMGRFLDTMSAANGQKSYVANTDMGAFCKALLAPLQDWTDFRSPEDIESFLPAPAEIAFRIYQKEEDRIACHATVTYGDDELNLFEDVYELGVTRDVAAETKAQAVVESYFYELSVPTPNYLHPHPGKQRDLGLHQQSWGSAKPIEDPCFYTDDDATYYAFFTEGVSRLAELGQVELTEALAHVKVERTPRVNVEATVHGKLLDLKVTSDEMEPAELMEYLSRWRKKETFVRLTDGDILKLDSSIASVAALADGLGLSERDMIAGVSLNANRTLFVDALLKRQEGVIFSRNDAFRRIVRDFETVADADFRVPDTVEATLRPYQTEGLCWLCTLGHVGFGGILADDMGLGKTLQAISYLAHVKQEASNHTEGDHEHLPSLVVCPASLVYNWESEIERFCPTLSCCCLVGSKRTRDSLIESARDYDVLITSYDLMKRDVEKLSGVSFHAIILDEAQYIKNPATLAAKAAKRLVGEVHFALTGTPIENRLTELWSIFDFLMPGVLGTKEDFSRRFANPISSGDEVSTKNLARLVSPFILRRLKKDVLKDLPDKIESLVSSSLAGEQKKLYNAHAQRLRMTIEHQLPEEFAGMRLEILAELTKLRQICCDPSLAFEDWKGPSAKLETCMELISQAHEGGHQILVFSQFTSMLQIIAERLKAAKLDYFTLTGSTSKEERRRLVERFQQGAVPVFLISLKAGGVGLNLTAADIVIHYDPWWNVAAEDQATDRTHRIGQENEVSVFKLIAKDTIEEKIVEMQKSKRALADAVVGGKGVQTSSITREDLLNLLEA